MVVVAGARQDTGCGRWRACDGVTVTMRDPLAAWSLCINRDHAMFCLVGCDRMAPCVGDVGGRRLDQGPTGRFQPRRTPTQPQLAPV